MTSHENGPSSEQVDEAGWHQLLGPGMVNHQRGTALPLPFHSAQALSSPGERMGGEQGTETWYSNCKAEGEEPVYYLHEGVRGDQQWSSESP